MNMEICAWELVNSLENENSWFCVWCCAWFPDNNYFSGHFITSPLCRAVHDTLFEKQHADQSYPKPLQCLACYKTFPTQVSFTHHFGLVIECQQKIHEYLRSTIGSKPFIENRDPSISKICFDSQFTNDELMRRLLERELRVNKKTNTIVNNAGKNVIGLKTELKQFEINRHDNAVRLKQCKLSLDPEKRERKRLRDLERKRFIRNNLNESEKIKRRLLDSEKKRIMRANLDEDEKARLRRLETERKRVQRANMDDGEKARLRKLEAERQRMRRASRDKAQQAHKGQKNTEMNMF